MAIFYINSNYQNADIVTYCCTQLHFKLPGAFDEQCNAKFVVKYYSCDNVFGVNSITLDFCLDCLYFPHSVILWWLKLPTSKLPIKGFETEIETEKKFTRRTEKGWFNNKKQTIMTNYIATDLPCAEPTFLMFQWQRFVLKSFGHLYTSERSLCQVLQVVVSTARMETDEQIITNKTSSVAAGFCRYGMSPIASKPDLWPFDLETGMWVASKVGNLPSILGTQGLCVLELYATYTTDGRTDDERTKAMLIAPLPTVWGIIITQNNHTTQLNNLTGASKAIKRTVYSMQSNKQWQFIHGCNKLANIISRFGNNALYKLMFSLHQTIIHYSGWYVKLLLLNNQ